MSDPEPRECCATTTDCHHLDDCTERPAAEFLGRFQDGGGSACSPEITHVEWAEFIAIREALGEHFVMWHSLDKGNTRTWSSAGPPGEWRCSCGLKFGFSDSALDHVADVVARLSENPQDFNRCPGSLRPPRPGSTTNSTVGDVGVCPRCGRYAKLRPDGSTRPHERRDQGVEA